MFKKTGKVQEKIDQVRELVFLVISPWRGSINSNVKRLSFCFDWLIATLIVISSSLAFASTFTLPEGCRNALMRLDVVILWIFTVEYLLRVWTADLYFKADRRKRKFERFRRMWKFIWSPLAIIDLIAILPFWLLSPETAAPSVFMALRVFRLARLLRYAARYEKVLDNMAAVLKEQKKELKVSLIAIGALIMVASMLMYAVEHEKQPEKFSNGFSGLWWAVTTITTLGYGDIAPITTWGRFWGAVIALAGVAALAVPTAIINSGFVKRSMTAEDLERLLSEKDQQQDRELEKQRNMIADLKNRVADFENLLREKEREQKEVLDRQGQEQIRQSEKINRFTVDTNGRLDGFENLLQEKGRELDEGLAEQRHWMDGFAAAARERLDNFERRAGEVASGFSTVMEKHGEGVDRLLKLAEERFSKFERQIEDQQHVIENYFMPKEKSDGAVVTAVKHVASKLTFWKGEKR